MSFKNNKNIGNTALGVAISYFTNIDCCVSIPLNDTQDYDLIVDFEHRLQKIQVRGTSQKSRYGISIVHLNSIGGRYGKTYKTLINTDIDYLFVVTNDLIKYLIPKQDIKNKYSINLNKTYDKYIVNY